MKPIAELTEQEKAHFFTLFIGECWHEWEWKNELFSGFYECKCGEQVFVKYADGHQPKNIEPTFSDIKAFMEKERSELWEEYLDSCAISVTKADSESPIGFDIRWTDMLQNILNLDNLLSFLWENREEWGWKECSECKGIGHSAYIDLVSGETKPLGCETCNGTGRVKHPAYIYLESL